MKAADIMTTTLVTVPPDMPVGKVAEVLALQRFGSVPVVANDGEVLGVVTEEDLVIRAASLHLPRYIDFLGGVIFLENPQRFEEEAGKILAVTAGDIMDRQFASIAATTPVTEVADRLLHEDLRRVFVMDEQRHLQGIITRADIVRMQTTSSNQPGA